MTHPGYVEELFKITRETLGSPSSRFRASFDCSLWNATWYIGISCSPMWPYSQMSLHSKAPTEQAPFAHAQTRCSVLTAHRAKAPHRIPSRLCSPGSQQLGKQVTQCHWRGREGLSVPTPISFPISNAIRLVSLQDTLIVSDVTPTVCFCRYSVLL
jgi:hypothetical protein